MAREIYAAHRKGEYTSAFPEREHGRDVQLVSMAVWMQAKFKTTTTTAGGGLKTIEEDVRMLCEDGCLEKEENKSAAAYDEVGIECNDKMNELFWPTVHEYCVYYGQIEVGRRSGYAFRFDVGGRTEKEGVPRRRRSENEEEKEERGASERGGEGFVEVRFELRRRREEG